MKTILTLLLTLMTSASYSQSSDTSLFNFWLGKWDAHWFEPNGKDTVKATGENIVERTLGGKVIHEHFKVLSGKTKGFIGESWSVLSKATGNWHQTWVDNQGAYLDFVKGNGPGGAPTFERKIIKNGKEILQRMVFRNITADSFTWEWEMSIDGGKTFNLAWRIFYERRKT